MIFQRLGLTLILLLTSSIVSAKGRGPAVEDFVGIEMEQTELTPQGTEGLFNFEKDIHDYQSIKDEKSKTKLDQLAQAHKDDSPFSLITTLSVIALIGLPLTSWFFFMYHFKKKANTESASNIEVLEKYRKERELNQKDGRPVKKAS